MTILQLITRRQYRGAEVFAAQLSEELLKAGHRVILAGLYAPPKDKVLTIQGGENLDLSQGQARAVPHYGILKRIAQLVAQERVDIVQANSSDNLKYAVLSQKIFGWQAPIVFRNASVLSAWLRGPLHRGINRWLLQQTAAIACVSRLSKQDLQDHLQLPAERLHYLPIGTHIIEHPDPLSARKYLVEALNISENALIIIHVGAFSPEKNQDQLVTLLHELPARINAQPIHLVMVGEGSLRPQVMELAASLDLEDSAHFMGYRSDVPRFLAAADLFVLPSSIEGTPGVLLEAAAHGVAAVAYDVGAVRECFPEGLASALVPAEDFSRLSETVTVMLRSEELRNRQARVTKDYVIENYDLSVVARKFAELYAELMKSYA